MNAPFKQPAGTAYRSPFLRELRILRTAIPAVALVCLVFGAVAPSRLAEATRTIGQDASASVVAAEKAKAGMAAAHADLEASLLAGEGMGGKRSALERQREGDVEDALVDAAGNVTYGEEETGPLKTMERGLARYEKDAGAARAATGDEARSARDDADKLMQWSLLPAAATLDRVNMDHLEASYLGVGVDGSTWFGACAWALVATALLGGASVLIRRRTRRLVNVPLLVAMALVVGSTVVGTGLFVDAMGSLTRAKEDAFDSVDALWNARAVAQDARAAAIGYVLDAARPARAAKFASEWTGRTAQVLGAKGASVEDGMRKGLSAKAVRDALPGFLGEELSNVTFEGEEPPARRAILAWRDFVSREEAAMGKATTSPSDAAEAALSDKQGSADSAFAVFDRAVGTTIAINQDAFRSAVGRAGSDLRDCMLVMVVGMMLAAAMGAYGVQRRIDEFRA